MDAPTGNAARVTPPAQDDGRRSPNDVDESDPEQRALLDAENDMLAADLGSFASASVDDLAEDQEADIFLQVKDAIDTFLLYDFFVICVILLWLVVGVLQIVPRPATVYPLRVSKPRAAGRMDLGLRLSLRRSNRHKMGLGR